MKIYNEITIDMNPESSSYGETLHEDSFEYEGEMILAQAGRKTIDNRIMATNHYYDHNWKSGLPIVEFDTPTGRIVKIYNKNADTVLQEFSYPTGNVDIPWQQINNRANDWAIRLDQTEAGTWTGSQEVEVAPDIDYNTVSRFIDKNTGDITNKDGLVSYLMTLPGFESKSVSQIESALTTMPDLSVSGADLATAKGKYTSDVSALTGKMTSERMGAQTAEGISGVSNPLASGFGGQGETFAEGLYGQLGSTQAQFGDLYGLGEEKEQAMGEWAKSLLA